jgi:diguanylate cyclase (GGDEF)-like protein
MTLAAASPRGDAQPGQPVDSTGLGLKCKHGRSKHTFFSGENDKVRAIDVFTSHRAANKLLTHIMQFHDAKISHGPQLSKSVRSVPATARLRTVDQEFDLNAMSYLLVEDDRGEPIGLVATDRIRAALNSEHERERQRWETMPVEALMDARLLAGSPAGSTEPGANAETVVDCLAVRSAGELFAVLTDDDVLVSWKTIEKTLQYALVDPVTLLPNRSVFDNHLRAECNRARRTKNSVAVIMIDIDHFKKINDDFGHTAGDTTLRLVSQTIRNNLRSYDLLARYGGDELVVVCSGCRPNEIEIPIRRLQDGVKKISDYEDLPYPPPTLSIGACVVHSVEDMCDPVSIIAAADECLYRAKQAGRNCSFATEIGKPHPDAAVNTTLTPDPMTAWEQLRRSGPEVQDKNRHTD